MRFSLVVLAFLGLHVWLCHAMFSATDVAMFFEPEPGDEEYAPMANMLAGVIGFLLFAFIEFIICLVIGCILYFIGGLIVLRINGPFKRLKTLHWFLMLALVGLAAFLGTATGAWIAVSQAIDRLPA